MCASYAVGRRKWLTKRTSKKTGCLHDEPSPQPVLSEHACTVIDRPQTLRRGPLWSSRITRIFRKYKQFILLYYIASLPCLSLTGNQFQRFELHCNSTNWKIFGRGSRRNSFRDPIFCPRFAKTLRRLSFVSRHQIGAHIVFIIVVYSWFHVEFWSRCTSNTSKST